MDQFKRSGGSQFCPRCVAAFGRILPPELIEGEHARQALLAASAKGSGLAMPHADQTA